MNSFVRYFGTCLFFGLALTLGPKVDDAALTDWVNRLIVFTAAGCVGGVIALYVYLLTAALMSGQSPGNKDLP